MGKEAQIFLLDHSRLEWWKYGRRRGKHKYNGSFKSFCELTVLLFVSKLHEISYL